jgi:hypothetical protein
VNILAKDAKPGQRLSLDPDGNGRIVASLPRSGRARLQRRIIINWTDGSQSEVAANETLFLITPPQEAA